MVRVYNCLLARFSARHLKILEKNGITNKFIDLRTQIKLNTYLCVHG